MLNIRQANKIVSFGELPAIRAGLPDGVIVTNGCFDVLHVGHVRFLRHAADMGRSLVVGVNDDVGVSALKGAGRPINTHGARAEVLAALEMVDWVVIFPGTSAVDFLTQARPNIWVKGGDYTMKTLCQKECNAVHEVGGTVMLAGMTEGHSTTATLGKLDQN